MTTTKAPRRRILPLLIVVALSAASAAAGFDLGNIMRAVVFGAAVLLAFLIGRLLSRSGGTGNGAQLAAYLRGKAQGHRAGLAEAAVILRGHQVDHAGAGRTDLEFVLAQLYGQLERRAAR